MNYKILRYIITALLFAWFGGVYGAVRLPQLVANGMVLQRDTRIKLWGWADAGEKIRISFKGKSVSVKTNEDGKWTAELPAMHAGGPYTMQIDASNHITLSDILIGDVWFFSGQSNMTILMERVKELYPQDIATANYPQIRNFFVPTLADVRKVRDDLPPGKWISATPQTILNFGAVAYFMSRALYQKYHVPVGIINSSVGGTPVQAWISAEAVSKVDDVLAKRIAQFKDSSFYEQFKKVNRPQAAQTSMPQIADEGLKENIKWYDTAYAPKRWHKFWLPGYWADQGVKGLNGVVWFRKEVNVPASMAGKPAKLFMGRIIDADETYVNGQKVGNITYQYPPRRYDVPQGVLKAGKNLIVVRLTNTSGKGGFVPDKPYELTDGATSIDLRGDWQYRVGQVFNDRRSGFGSGPAMLNAQNEPSGLYNAMITPATNYALKGMVWYQGESNVGTKNYADLLKTLITDWRQRWGRGELPFLVVQLPNFGDVQYSPAESGWAEIREAQQDALTLPRTAMAITIDAGEWNDIHPLQKKIVGDRLALAARKLAYGDASVVASGPLLKSWVINGQTIELSFDYTGGGLMAAGEDELLGFVIAGADKRFLNAQAKIVGNKVVVSNSAISAPMYVRYAWADNPEEANFYNKEGLPAAPFRTDRPAPAHVK